MVHSNVSAVSISWNGTLISGYRRLIREMAPPQVRRLLVSCEIAPQQTGCRFVLSQDNAARRPGADSFSRVMAPLKTENPSRRADVFECLPHRSIITCKTTRLRTWLQAMKLPMIDLEIRGKRHSRFILKLEDNLRVSICKSSHEIYQANFLCQIALSLQKSGSSRSRCFFKWFFVACVGTYTRHRDFTSVKRSWAV